MKGGGGIGGWIAAAAKDLRDDIYEADRRIRARRDRLRRDRARITDLARFWWIDESKAPVSLYADDGTELGRALHVQNVGWIAFRRSVNKYKRRGANTLRRARDSKLKDKNWPFGAIVIVTKDGQFLMRGTDRDYTQYTEPQWGPLRGNVDFDRNLEWR